MARLDQAERFLFKNNNIRGERIVVGPSLQKAFNCHDYPELVKQLIGEAVAATLLISSTLKFEGTLSLQAQSDGPLSLLVVECNNHREFRALARWNNDKWAEETFAKLLSKGQIAITVTPAQGQRYQSIVPLQGETLSECLTLYFAQSEQLPTQLWLACDDNVAGGLLLQPLPQDIMVENGGDTDLDQNMQKNQWHHFTTLANTLKDSELLKVGTPKLLERIFFGENLILFDSNSVRYQCRCNRDRFFQVLKNLSGDELKALLSENGCVEAHCEFCNSIYQFNATDFSSTI